jgi:hypothetical protein
MIIPSITLLMSSLMQIKANLHNCMPISIILKSHMKMHASHYTFKMQFLPRKERKKERKMSNRYLE